MTLGSGARERILTMMPDMAHETNIVNDQRISCYTKSSPLCYIKDSQSDSLNVLF